MITFSIGALLPFLVLAVALVICMVALAYHCGWMRGYDQHAKDSGWSGSASRYGKP